MNGDLNRTHDAMLGKGGEGGDARRIYEDISMLSEWNLSFLIETYCDTHCRSNTFLAPWPCIPLYYSVHTKHINLSISINYVLIYTYIYACFCYVKLSHRHVYVALWVNDLFISGLLNHYTYTSQ